MHIININHITVNYAGREIFDDLTWVIGDRDRVGMVGPNGSGKSTLLKAVAAEVEPNVGSVVRMRGVTVGFLHQDIELPGGKTLIETAMIPPPRLAQTEATLNSLEEQLGDPEVYGNEDRLAQVMDQLEAATLLYDRLDGANHQNNVETVLFKLGFTEDDFDLPTNTLSGGQKKLIALTHLVLDQPDVLLLDEPDNHLDLRAKRHLETFIQGYNGGVVIVSHDRYLLDRTATQIVELEDGKLTVYQGNYTAYVNEREARRLRQQQAYVTQQKEIARIEEAIKRFELWASMVVNERHIKQARSRRKMLDRMEERGEIIDPVTEQRTMKMQINGWRGSTQALEINDLSMVFDGDPLFLDLNLLIRHGERVGLIGPNGAGKSVLFRLILGELETTEGEIKIGPSTQVGYYAQEHQTLNGWLDRTPIELIRDLKPMSENAAVAQLLRFAFSYEQTRQPIGTLSGGERSRIQLMRIMLQEPNLLLFDEPTNNLDIKSTEVLEDAIEDFEGAILAISHDRYFLERVVDRIIELKDGILFSYIGGYTNYLDATGQS